MVQIAELLATELDRLSPRAVSLGLVDLDRLWGGLLPERVVLVTSPPGHGKTAYATQLAARAAVTGRSVVLSTPRESPRAVAARLLAATARVSLDVLLNARPIDRDEQRRALHARLRLSAADLEIHCGAEQLVEGSAQADIVVLDDVHRGRLSDPSLVRRMADHGATVIATLPEDELCEGPVGLRPRLRRSWAEICDAAIGIELPSEESRQGEADVWVLKNRHGPTLHTVVVFQGTYSRFVDLDPD